MTEAERKEYIGYRIQNAQHTIAELKSHIENKFWNTAGSRMYYACFYAVSALLMKNQISVSTHSGVIQMFGQHFILTGKIRKELGKHYSELFEKRQRGDYGDLFNFDEETILRLYGPSVDLINTIEKLIKEIPSGVE
jgi:uncharacterized protein (UPF0332 family)